MSGTVRMGQALAWALASFGVPGEEPAPEPVTYTRDVAPILFENCAECHRPGQAAPFSLVDYSDASKRARMIALATRTRLMPPWPPVEGYGEFVGARHLSSEQVAILQAWAEQGAPEGDPRLLPERPEFSDDWRLGTPDLVLEMPRGFEVPADGQDIYRIFPLHTVLDRDRWLTALEVRPGPSGVLHHLRVGYDPTLETRSFERPDGQPGFEAMEGSTGARFGLGSYVVGSAPFAWPEGLEQLIPAGSDIVLNSHIHPVGKAAVERTQVGLYFSETPAAREVLRLSIPPYFGAYSGLDIPAGDKAFRLHDSFVLPVDAQAVIVIPHAHYLCRQVRLDATLPDGAVRHLLYIDDWRFEWQGAFRYEDPVELPAGTRLDAELIYDNSADNPANPFDPPQRVKWGMQSTEEMGTVGLALISKDPGDHSALLDAIVAKSQASSKGQRGKMMASRFRLFDRNGDGSLTPAEVPESYEPWFIRIDKDDDGVVTEAELRAIE